MHYFMAQILFFTDDSADAAINSLNLNRPTRFPYKRTLTSKEITLQIKQVMHKLVYGQTSELLEGLRTTMSAKNPSKGEWASSICAILILCMYAEIVHLLLTSKSCIWQARKGTSSYRGPRAWKNVGKYLFLASLNSSIPFQILPTNWYLENERGFNPIQDGLTVDNKKNLNEPITQFARWYSWHSCRAW